MTTNEIKINLTKDGEPIFTNGETLKGIAMSYLMARVLSDDKSPEMVVAIAELYEVISKH